MDWKYLALIVWIVVILTLVLLYFFAPEVYYHIFYEYRGPGGPFVNPPAG